LCRPANLAADGPFVIFKPEVRASDLARLAVSSLKTLRTGSLKTYRTAGGMPVWLTG